MEHTKDTILISKHNLKTYGFVCFHEKNQAVLKDNFWIREVELAIDPGKQRNIQKFKIPINLLVEISHVDRIIQSEHYTINSTVSTIGAIQMLAKRAGWNQTRADLESLISHARLPVRLGNEGVRMATFYFQNQNIPLGSGLALPVSDELSWIGMILVHPELRRQGIARSIMNSCLEHARIIQKKAIVGLDATPQGKQVYDSLGFKDSYKIWRSDISTDLEYHSVQTVELELFRLEAIEDYLERKNNTERFQIVELLSNLPDSKNIMAVSDGVVSGFAMSRPGRIKPFIGPIIADSEEIASSLLNRVLRHWKSMGYVHTFIDVPEQHIGQGSFFIDENEISDASKKPQIFINPIRSFVRMYQLISESELEEILQISPPHQQAGMSEASKKALDKAKDSYEKTLAYMEKEKQEILPSMYAIAGPEMS